MIRRTLLTGLMLGLGACASPYVQSPLAPPPGFTGPRIEPGAFVVQDGARLPYRRWSPGSTEPRAVVIALHGMNDHASAWRLAGPWWAERGIATYAYDQRGFGGAPGRGAWAGEALLVEDLRTVVALVRARHPTARIAVAGESMGGAVAICAFASDRPPVADQAILLAPAVWGWSSQNVANRASLWAAARLLGGRAVEAPDWAVRDIRATDNLAELVANGTDPLFIRATRFDTLSGLVDLMESAARQLGQVRVPTMLMYGAHDQIIEPGPMRRALVQAGDPPNLRTAWYPDGWHLLNRDLQAEVVFRDVAAVLADPAAILPSGAGDVLAGLTLSRRSPRHLNRR
ncbi:alpha/beta fold hydrolase [Brevundimonas subvibrioides]|uniref:Alpha/beta hydrolase fold protein n=1 Tax=Brevundimonas subvibrioides (strain ATCC 15264 / DSM 4735 / LMG 14903 / NBRC 16000 / CB 81) TaxID=633149 RepID=D9QMW5_BRESC|nr:alpha/beta fold hydrolase [Brevundimonas subvibrioides]ADL02121.1 alpha/beta hydrolase fold protein [Brevundimonas subvibrioides ATCC 15264]